MSVQRLLSRDLFFSTLIFASLLALVASVAQAGTPRLGPSWGVDRIRSEAREGDIVTLEGRVVSVSRSRFFTLQDGSGDQIIVVIPDHLLREIGEPSQGEAIRVRGKYDHKTHLDVDKSKESDPGKNWGIRVSAVDRNLATSGRNPNPPEHRAPTSSDAVTKAAPAAPMSAVTVGGPNIEGELKARLATARKTALAAQKKLENANTEFARGEYRKVEGAEKDALFGSQKRAQQEYDEAIAAMLPLVEEAHESGVNPKAIELYEAGLTKPRH
jgi:uncharacterized protein YdeI (BOF family)